MSYVLEKLPTSSFTSAENVPGYYGGPRELLAITIHHWGIDGQDFDTVVAFFQDDSVETSANEMIEAGRVALLVDHEDVAWHAGDKEGNRTTIGLELRPEATNADYETAAQRIADIRAEHGKDLPLLPHNHWKATTCPGRWDLDRLDKMARQKAGQTTQPSKEESKMATWSSPLPKGCRPTSPFGHRWGTLHAGQDWGPPKPGQAGIPIFAPHAFTVIATGYGYGRKNDRIPYHSGRFAWLDLGVHGGDRMRLYAGHLSSLSVKAGDTGQAGDQIGVMGGSGSNGENHFAIHAHIGIAQNHNRPVNAATRAGGPGWIDPLPWFRSKGINVGKDTPASGGSSGSGASPSVGSTSWAKKKTNRANVDVKKGAYRSSDTVDRLSAKGYTVNVVSERGSWTQIRNSRGNGGNAWVPTASLRDQFEGTWEWPDHKLKEDRDFGAVTRRAYQRLLVPDSVGGYTGWIDSVISGLSAKAEQTWLQKQGYYKGYIDGDRETLTIKALQNLLKDRGFYSGYIDGDFAGLSVLGLQKLMNSQQNLYK